MNPRLEQLLEGGDGFLRRDDVLRRLPSHLLDYALRTGALVRPLPQTCLLPSALDEPDIVLRAAIAYAQAPVAASHLSALRLWGLPTPKDAWIHLSTHPSRNPRGAPGVRIHRRKNFVPEPPEVLIRDGIPVSRLERSVVDSWPLLDGDDKRAPAIEAVNRRMTTAQRIFEALEDAPRLAGRRLLVQLLRRLADGCRSHLELWGFDHVFRGPSLSRLRWQVPVRVGEHTVYLDALDEESGVNIELDGATFHSSRTDRERDLRRDAALTALGFTVVRFTSTRLRKEPTLVRGEALSIIEAHRRRRRS